VPAHGVVAILVVFCQARQVCARCQRLVEQLDGQDRSAVLFAYLFAGSIFVSRFEVNWMKFINVTHIKPGDKELDDLHGLGDVCIAGAPLLRAVSGCAVIIWIL
jgi:hypothetical protein